MPFYRGQIPKPEETDAFFFMDGSPQDPVQVLFTVWNLTIPSQETVVGLPNQPADRLAVGRWYARFLIPEDAPYGDYRIDFIYAIRAENGELLTRKIELPIQILAAVAQPSDPLIKGLIDRLRIRLRDNNPDAYYRFAPPIATGIISGFTRNKGFIWQDDELQSFLQDGIDTISAFWFGFRVDKLTNLDSRFHAVVLLFAAAYALHAEAVRWISEEFRYDLDGVSLEIDRSSKFQQMGDMFATQAAGQMDAIAAATTITKGIKATYGVSRGAALGPRIGHTNILNYIRGNIRG